MPILLARVRKIRLHNTNHGWHKCILFLHYHQVLTEWKEGGYMRQKTTEILCSWRTECTVFFFFFFLVFRDRVSLYSPRCPGTHFVDQAGLELRNPPASVLGSKLCATTHSCTFFLGTYIQNIYKRRIFTVLVSFTLLQ